MLFPEIQKRQLKRMAEHAGPDWNAVPDAQNVAKLGLQMEAALRMVLMFHGGDWYAAERAEWLRLQEQIGVEFPQADATTRILCDTIRMVLGVERD